MEFPDLYYLSSAANENRTEGMYNYNKFAKKEKFDLMNIC